MAGENGTDLGHLVAMVASVLAGQEQMRVEFRAEIGQLRSEVNGLRAELTALKAELTDFKAETRQNFADLRETINLYHGSVVGHGIAISELQDEVRQIREHLGLPRG